MHTPEQIEAKAKIIGDRPYFPCNWQGNPNGFQNSLTSSSMPGITIRQELMRTAMGGFTSNDKWTDTFSVDENWEDYIYRLSSGASELTNAILLQMAKDELNIQ